jgi:predicted esterase
VDANGRVNVLHVATRTHGRVLVQPAAQPKGLLVGFHGYAESAAIQMQRLAAIPDAGAWTCVAVQGLHRFYRGRSRETLAGWMTREDRELLIADNIEYVDAVMASVADPARRLPIVYAGFSQGVAMAFRAGVLGRETAAGIIAVGADVPPELANDPRSRFPPVLMLRGSRDEWYTQDTFETDVETLRARGTDVNAVVFDGGHEWTDAVAREAAHFLWRFAA